MNYIEALDVRKEFGENNSKIVAVDSVDLSIETGRIHFNYGRVRVREKHFAFNVGRLAQSN